ncbi:MAG: SDR family oxidoreductase [Proteobacteria bacterium]|nr:SDR family oxidoreductase [Pseudomonadota bacterium]
MDTISDKLPDVESVRGLFSLAGKVALVTGSGSGLCRAIAWGMACNGADIAIVDRDGKAAATCAAELRNGTGRHIESFQADVSNESEVANAVSGALETFGHIDVLLNGAGHNIRKPLVEFTQAEFDSLMQVHVRGAFFFCRAIAPGMRERKSGSIINVASIAAFVGIREIAPYSAAKAALLQFSRAFALEMAPFGVRVNAIAPGFIDTPLTRQHSTEKRRKIEEISPTGRFGGADELIGPAIFLASDASSFVTGTSVVVDGAWSAQ